MDKDTVLEIVDKCFKMYASSYRIEANECAIELIDNLEAKLQNHSDLSNVSNCDLCNGTGYISVDNLVVECHWC